MAEPLSLKSLLVPSKSTEVEFPGFEGFKLQLSFLSRETLVSIRKKSIKTTFNNRTRQPTEELDDKLFLKLYVAAAIKGWSGFKYKYLNDLAPSEISPADFEKEVPYSEENALTLMEASASFDSFISETVSDLSNFTKSST
jgi:hypothetical protein